MAITPAKLEILRKDLEAAMVAVCEKHQLNVNIGAMKYSATDVRMTVSFGDKDTIGEGTNPEYALNLRRNGPMYGLNMSSIGKTVKVGAAIVTLQGMRGKFAIMKKSDGKLYRYDAALIGQLFKAMEKS